jgi:Predicted Zn-dependent protease
MVLALYAQNRIASAYAKNSKINARSGITGRRAAEEVMRSAGIFDVEIVEIKGHLTDHYDPVNKRLALSSENYRGTSLAALGVAAHEAGHAIQHHAQYAPLKLRMAIVPVTQIASSILPFAVVVAMFGLTASALSVALNVIVTAYLVLTFFQLVTLPVEFNASTRAKQKLHELGIVGRDELAGVDETLDAAAFTYLAAFVTSLMHLLHFLSRRR